MTKSKLNRKSGQTMVEYIIIVVLVAISLIALFGKFGKAAGKKTAGMTAALDEQVGAEAAAISDANSGTGEELKKLDTDGNINK